MKAAYNEIVVEGPFGLIRSFVQKVLEDRGVEDEPLFARENHVKRERKMDHILRMIKVKEDRIALFCLLTRQTIKLVMKM